MTFRIQYASDLHLELYKTLPAFKTLLNPVAPYLALAGDIGHPKQLRPFFAWAAPKWKHIFYVAGNHEYYNFHTKTTMADRVKELEAECSAYDNIHFLHSSSHFLEEENTVIVGTTLWSDPSPHERWERMNDFHCIYAEEGRRISVSEMRAFHIQEKQWLDREITHWKSKGVQMCVITHHMPSMSLIEAKYRGCDMNSFFASNCDALLRSPVAAWIYGHTHSAGKMRTANRIPCVINARGYEDEFVEGFTDTAVLEISYTEPTDPMEMETRSESIEEDIVWT